MDNITFLENLGRYLLYQVAIKIYHQSSIYFYKYQLNKDFLHLLPFYYAYHLEHYGGFDKGALVYRNIEYIGDGYGIDKTILVDNSILNDFVKFKLKKNINSWSIHAYRKEDLAADTIKSAWKKNKWNYLKNLAAWKYHPSRLTFEIE
jgi:hypothetical protein